MTSGFLLTGDDSSPQFLYLSTVGWKTGRKHRIEIWFVEHNGRYYILSEGKERAHWVQNITHDPAVSFSISGRSCDGKAGVVSSEKEPALAAKVSELMKKKYGWGDGMIVELTPES